MPRPNRAFAAYIAADKDFRGIGQALAARLESRFGEQLRDVIASQDPRVAEVVGEENAQNAFVAYAVKSGEADVVDWLQRNDIDHEVGIRTAVKIAHCWGGDAAPALRENPYVLLAFLPWPVVDRIARRLGVTCDDSRRRAAAIEAILYERLDQNDTTVPLENVRHHVEKLIGSLDEANFAKAVNNAIRTGGAALLGNELQPYGAATMEAEIAQWVSEAREKTAYADLALPLESDTEIEKRIAAFEASNPYPLTEKQREAIRLGLTSRIMILAGYAGAGKTTSLKGVCDIAQAQGRNLHLIALSGRAAQRMRESTGLPASTIAGFLISVRGGQRAIAPGDLVIVDEASMVDLPLLWRILRIIGDGSLILVGDPAQLPPIGFGLTFHALCDDRATPHTVLDQVLRQTAESGIPKVAEAIRNGDVVDLPQFNGLCDGVSFTPCEANDAIERLQAIYKRLIQEGVCEEDIQIIAPIRRGPAGVTAINRAFHQTRYEDTAEEFFPGRDDIAAGDPIIWTKNDWDRELMNGSLGRILSVHDDVAHTILDGFSHDLTICDADYIDLGYAISVHKSQGSQWPIVIVPIFQSKILDRSLIYTAITRAAKQVILIGDSDAFRSGVRANPAAKRRKVGLGIWLQEGGVGGGGAGANAAVGGGH